ncbi:MAG: metalloregulator ArsR/SmtB family transcription factor [Thermoleophilia bacterium]
MNTEQEDSAAAGRESAACCDYKTLVGVFKALSDASRQKILLTLENDGEMRVGELVEHLDISQPTMSHHLGVLKNVGLVEDRRQGKSIYYHVNRDWLTECCRPFMSRFSNDD